MSDDRTTHIPHWAAAIAVSCLILLVGAWGGSTAASVNKNRTAIVESREQAAEVKARLCSLETRVEELQKEIRALVLAHREGEA